MTSKYSIFKDGYTTKEYRIYPGIFEKENKNREMVYCIKQNDKITELYDLNNSIVLKSKYINWSKSKSLMEGYHTSFSMKRWGAFIMKFTFHLDFKNSYIWRCKFFNSSYWYLKDDQDQLIADIEFTTWARKKQGTLTIYHQVPSPLKDCIILSQIIVYQSVKRSASSAGTGGAMLASGGGGGGGGC
ncbi:unnamed protein product [Cunninghamella blakesleeana]